MRQKFSRRWTLRVTAALGLVVAASFGVNAIIMNEPLVPALHPSPLEERSQILAGFQIGPDPEEIRNSLHVSQAELTQLNRDDEDGDKAYELAFELGDVAFGVPWTAVDGSGANVGEGLRYTRMPRADLNGATEWASHFPPRSTGPNGNSCAECHNLPAEDGAGGPGGNVHRDPLHTGDPAQMITRNTPHLFGIGAVQLLAEEMTTVLRSIRDQAIAQANGSGSTVTLPLTVNGINFGTISADPGDTPGTTDKSGVVGIDNDLIVKPFQWKGENASLREFIRGAAHNELGMTATELVGTGIDSDGDGIVNELTVGDITAMTIYNAAQPRPTTLVELSDLGIGLPLTAEERNQIRKGRNRFYQAGCTECHKEKMKLRRPIFQEPSRTAGFRDNVFPSGDDPVAQQLNPNFPTFFDLTTQLPNNVIPLANGTIFSMGNFETDARGRALVFMYGDMKRHDMGPELAENIDEIGTGASVWLTEPLWGVGSTAPYMHDGRASTLTEAILLHGGEAAASRDAFLAMNENKQAQMIAFLNNLVLFKLPE